MKTIKLLWLVFLISGLCFISPVMTRAGEGTLTEYILPDSDRRFLTEEDIASLSLRELNYAKNEIYARRGRRFLSAELQNYFNGKDWYLGLYEPEDFDANYADAIMNEFEKVNANFLSEAEYSRNPEGYQLDAPEQIISPEDQKAMELYGPVLEAYAEGARTDFAGWNAEGTELIEIDPNNPWTGSEVCYAFIDLADDGVPELLIGRIPTEADEENENQPHGIVMYTKTPTNCLYAVYGYENGEVKRILGDGEWGWHINGCITTDKKIWKKGYFGGGLYDFGLYSVSPNGVTLNWEIYMQYNAPDFPFEYSRLINGEWVLSSEEEYRSVSPVTPMEIDWKPLLSL